MTQVTVYIPGRVPHRIPGSAVKKFKARYPEAQIAPAATAAAVGTVAASDSEDKTLAPAPLSATATSRLRKAELLELLHREFAFSAPAELTRTELLAEVRRRRGLATAATTGKPR